jgi:2OG-Fe(II) oxygenase superfamily
MPGVFLKLAHDAAASAGFEGCEPDACLINRYDPGARLSLHQDKNERDFEAPIVSVGDVEELYAPLPLPLLYISHPRHLSLSFVCRVRYILP